MAFMVDTGAQMEGKLTRIEMDELVALIGGSEMTSQQFELFVQQLKHLSPQQLRSLQSEISSNLPSEPAAIINDDEMQLISSLFSN
ncbi:hypothetical protein [Vibrio mexicanus]|uniref:hypothetical protein n=1 Tax=Vibrio mexicanus TaxID=1004326 RepID=UPI000AA75559|nr:hypothetical protein [Vibrio mexicanus]